ncbi:Microsomal dipeptidase [hydrothermal vent metagenome]|uniref:Microsomal dipeptidase n=1 Tax=hydrothermal vent metagenome TaxID=652676 RepID=A0A3B0RQQ0_9ZZZZ
MADYKIFDGHNDTLLKLELLNCSENSQEFFDGFSPAHIDLPRATASGFAGGFFAMWVPSTLENTDFNNFDPRDFSNFAEIGQEDALRFTHRMFSRALRLEKSSNGRVKIVRSAPDIRAAADNGQLAMLMHIEGAEAIDPDFNALEVLYSAGLRSIGLVWSRNNIFADGVPMGFPGSPDTGNGLTDKGKELVRLCNQKGVMIDLSHLNEKGFWDVARISDAPLVATHSNVHEICPSPRNLTDKQLGAIAESKGVVGLNYHVGFLRPDGRRDTDTDLEIMIRHLSYLVEKLGETGVALGSDFDGCLVPEKISDVRGNAALIEAMEKAQFGQALIRRICFENWCELLDVTLEKN